MSERRAGRSSEPTSARKAGPSRSELLKLKSPRLAAPSCGHRSRHGAPLTEADPGWQTYLKAHARFEAAWRKAGFDPDQPRVPAGNPDGGQWTSGGGGGLNDPRVLSDATPDDAWIPGARYAQSDGPRYPVDLSENAHVLISP